MLLLQKAWGQCKCVCMCMCMCVCVCVCVIERECIPYYTIHIKLYLSYQVCTCVLIEHALEVCDFLSIEKLHFLKNKRSVCPVMMMMMS